MTESRLVEAFRYPKGCADSALLLPWMYTCQHALGCFLARMKRVSGLGSSSYLSNGRLSMIMGSWLVHEKVTLGCADRCGSEGALLSGQNASGSGQKPTAKPFCADRGTWIRRLKMKQV